MGAPLTPQGPIAYGVLRLVLPEGADGRVPADLEGVPLEMVLCLPKHTVGRVAAPSAEDEAGHFKINKPFIR